MNFLKRTGSEWLSSLPVFCLLLLTLVIGTGEMIHGQLLRTGERLFGNPDSGIQYFMLRADPVRPDCDPNQDIDAALASGGASASSGGGGMDDIDALFADDVVDVDAQRQSLEKARELCREKFAMYENVSKHMTPEVKTYRQIETTFFGIFRFGTENRGLLLLVMVFIASITTSLGLHHIALRPPKTRTDFRVYSIAMLVANAVMVYSTVAYMSIQNASGVAVDRPYINWIWIAMFGGITLISLKSLLIPPKNAEVGGSVGKALLSIPLYAVMAMMAGFNFIADGHHAGLAIYLGQMMELSGVFLNLALYIWAGMLLKQTRVVDYFMDILRPWGFSPEMLTWIILTGAAFATAYTGASGIFVIAAGGIIYREVLASGARRQYALAATAMSGSMGVVLAPCLLIVVIAALNKQVTTSVLYGWGFWVFLLTSTLFLIASQLVRQQKIRIQRPAIALPASARALIPLAPYVVICSLIVMFYGGEVWGLNTKLDEFTASLILPVILMGFLAFDKVRRVDGANVPDATLQNERRTSLEEAIRAATNETISHVGALIMLAALSVSVGGMIERSGMIELLPQTLGNKWIALTFIGFMLVFVGMVMEAFGAVILVTATIAPIAYSNGIHPVHFWMIVLAAFELGYLTPPVALNQLLSRQVVGESEMQVADAEVKDSGFFWRYERWLLPLVVMFLAFLMVVYGGAFINWEAKPSLLAWVLASMA